MAQSPGDYMGRRRDSSHLSGVKVCAPRCATAITALKATYQKGTSGVLDVGQGKGRVGGWRVLRGAMLEVALGPPLPVTQKEGSSSPYVGQSPWSFTRVLRGRSENWNEPRL